MITWKNYEEYMMMHADGELSPAEDQELMSFLFEHPELQSELTAFSMAKLMPDAKLVFTAKEQLMQPVARKKVLVLPNWRRYAIAAGIAALLFVAYLKIDTNNKEVTRVAVAELPAPAINKPAALVDEVAQVKEKVLPPVLAEAVASVTKERHSVRPDVKHEKAIARSRTFAAMEIAQLEPAAIAALEEKPIISAVSVTNVPSVAIQEERMEARKTLIDRLPIDELKKKGMEHAVAALATGYSKVNTVTQEIYESSISLKVEKRKLILSF